MLIYQYKWGFTLTFAILVDNDTIYRFKKTSNINTLPKAEMIRITEFIVIVPLLVFKTASKFRLVNELQKLNYIGQNV